MLLQNKVAVIYGAGGSVGGTTARAFAREGARVFLVGRTLEPLKVVADDIVAGGGVADVAQVDALDKEAVEEHMKQVVERAGRVDISFNVIGLGHAQGTPLLEMTPEFLASPIDIAMRAQFLTATAAGRHMSKQGSGVILAFTAQAGRKPYPKAGGFSVACAAIEGLCRQLAQELGPKGIRVICLRSSGSPDTPGVRAAMQLHAENAGVSLEEWQAHIAEATLLKRMPLLAEVANAAVLMASDHASAMTGAIANLTCGELVD
jgi:NAD(P)-dependent dehydrogenase (short-subunit alcohol dehydrogenase family)